MVFIKKSKSKDTFSRKAVKHFKNVCQIMTHISIQPSYIYQVVSVILLENLNFLRRKSKINCCNIIFIFWQHQKKKYIEKISRRIMDCFYVAH